MPSVPLQHAFQHRSCCPLLPARAVSYLETSVLDYVRGVEGIRDNSTPNVLHMLDAVGFETAMHSSPAQGGWGGRQWSENEPI